MSDIDRFHLEYNDVTGQSTMIDSAHGEYVLYDDYLQLQTTIEQQQAVIDLARFMCETWAEIDKWAYENVAGDVLAKYPVIQGTSNQINLMRIGQQQYDKANISKAVKWLLNGEALNKLEMEG